MLKEVYMTDDEREDWAKELQQIASKIDELASDLTNEIPSSN